MISIINLFHIEIQRQCRFAELASEQIKTGLESGNTDLVWYAIQSLLIAAGNISKIFWPNDSSYNDRGIELRKYYDIQDDSPLKQRLFRNHFEHFDDRLHIWASSVKSNIFADSNIGPMEVWGISENAFLRNFDPSKGLLSFRGEDYDLNIIRDAIQHVKEKCIHGE